MHYTTHTDRYINTCLHTCIIAHMLTHPDPHLAHIYPHTPLDVPKHLSVSQYLPVVNMEHVASGGDHDVVVVAVSNAQHIGGHTVASTGGSEGLNSLGERGVEGWGGSG